MDPFPYQIYRNDYPLPLCGGRGRILLGVKLVRRMRMGKYPFLYIYFIYIVPDVNGLKLFASCGCICQTAHQGSRSSELSVGGIQRPFRRWRVTFTRPFSLLHLFGWCRWNVSGRLLFIWMGRQASDSGNGNQLLLTKCPKLVFHLRQHGGQV